MLPEKGTLRASPHSIDQHDSQKHQNQEPPYENHDRALRCECKNGIGRYDPTSATRRAEALRAIQPVRPEQLAR